MIPIGFNGNAVYMAKGKQYFSANSFIYLYSIPPTEELNMVQTPVNTKSTGDLHQKIISQFKRAVRPRQLLMKSFLCGVVLFQFSGFFQASASTVTVLTYSYDGSSRLTNVHFSSGSKLNYVYDAAGNQTSVTSTFIPSSLGDYNRDGIIDLKDLILSLQTLSGYQNHGLDLSAEVNTDGKIGMAEAIYVLQSVGL